MNAQTPIRAAANMLDIDAACSRFNQWRGETLENFARCEQAVTQTIALLNEKGGGTSEGKSQKFPHLIGQRYDHLAILLSELSSVGSHYKVALGALQQCRTHDLLRTMLCHGVTKVAIDRSGRWLSVMSVTTFRAKHAATDKLTLEEVEATAILQQIIGDRNRLLSVLGQVRRQISQPT